MNTNASTRREFIRSAATASAGALAGSLALNCPAAPGRPKIVPPSGKIVMGSIGTGGMGSHDMTTFMGMPDVRLVAVCDVDKGHREAARAAVNNHYKNDDCVAYKDFRELLARTDLDAVHVATPDHWHGLITVAALKSGRDVYCQKPLGNSIGETKAIRDTSRETGRIVQTGSQERSNPDGRFACELVRNGRIGKLHTVRVNLPCTDGHHQEAMSLKSVPPAEPIPEGFDYDFWLGHTPTAPYAPRRCHFWWRFILAHGGGEMTDRGAHVIDIGQLGAGKDSTGPVEVTARGEQTPGSLYDAFWNYSFENTYADGLKLIGESDERKPRGVRFEGSDGWILVKIHGCGLEAHPASLLKETIGESEIHLGRSPENNHYRNFIECIRSRKEPMACAETGHRTATLCHLNNIAMRLGRKLRWDPDKEHFIGDDAANDLITPKMRAPWRL